jgi:hypothetical protein
MIGILVLAIGGPRQHQPEWVTQRHTHSGVQGRTTIDGEMPRRPRRHALPGSTASIRVTVTRTDSDKVITVVTTDVDGQFRMPLPPGTYLLRPDNLDAAPRDDRVDGCGREHLDANGLRVRAGTGVLDRWAGLHQRDVRACRRRDRDQLVPPRDCMNGQRHLAPIQRWRPWTSIRSGIDAM